MPAPEPIVDTGQQLISRLPRRFRLATMARLIEQISDLAVEGVLLPVGHLDARLSLQQDGQSLLRLPPHTQKELSGGSTKVPEEERVSVWRRGDPNSTKHAGTHPRTERAQDAKSAHAREDTLLST